VPVGAKSAADIQGFEYDWLATDGEGHVALFSTAGAGYAPDEYLQDTDAHDAAVDAILAERPSTMARFAPELKPGLRNTWRMVADRGLFAFDSDPNGAPYRLVAAPERPVSLDQLPTEVAAVAARIVFHHLRFATLVEVSHELLQRRQ
jgi:hypothetical protein